MSFLGDIWSLAKTGTIDLDEAEAAMLGAPAGETISLWAAMSARHGSALGHIACAFLYVVQTRHCYDQLNGVPMNASNYIRAGVLLIGAPVAAALGIVGVL